jgi:hypothetical protein
MTPIDSEKGSCRRFWTEATMLSAGERVYLLIRERQSRVMATRARDPAARYVHIRLAEAYARRAQESESGGEGEATST